jgi:L-ribulose-5-phosphate 4-epimerase
VTSHDDLRERVFAAGQAVVAAGLVELTFGNASAIDRAAGLVAIKPSGVAYEAMAPESIVIVDLESAEVVDGDHRPSSDTPTHLVLYRRFAALGGVVHTHSRHATAWAQAGRAIPCFGTTHADHFHGPVPVTRALAPDEIEADYEERTGDVIVETFMRAGIDPLEVPAVLVASHGAFTWGADVEAAVENAVALEIVAELALNTLALSPGADPIDDALLQRHFSRKHGPDAYYGQVRA